MLVVLQSHLTWNRMDKADSFASYLVYASNFPLVKSCLEQYKEKIPAFNELYQVRLLVCLLGPFLVGARAIDLVLFCFVCLFLTTSCDTIESSSQTRDSRECIESAERTHCPCVEVPRFNTGMGYPVAAMV